MVESIYGVNVNSSCITTGSTTSGTFTTGDGLSYQYLPGRVGDIVYSNYQLVIPNTKKENIMRGLFIVYIVDYKKSKVLFVSEPLIADNEQKVQMKALQAWGGDVDLDDLDILVQRIGNVRAKKETQEVKILKD